MIVEDIKNETSPRRPLSAQLELEKIHDHLEDSSRQGDEVTRKELNGKYQVSRLITTVFFCSTQVYTISTR